MLIEKSVLVAHLRTNPFHGAAVVASTLRPTQGRPIRYLPVATTSQLPSILEKLWCCF